MSAAFDLSFHNHGNLLIIYKDIIALPMAEREKLFTIIARKGFDKDYYTYDEVFDDIPSVFTIKEASGIWKLLK